MKHPLRFKTCYSFGSNSGTNLLGSEPIYLALAKSEPERNLFHVGGKRVQVRVGLKKQYFYLYFVFWAAESVFHIFSLLVS